MVSPIETKEITIEVPGGTVYAKKWIPGAPLSGDPVVLLHDSLGSVDVWRDFPVLLAQGLSRTVIAYDRLGFGKSGACEELPSIEFIKNESTHYFPVIKKSLSLSRYLLLGHSVGGAMAINIAARDKDCKSVITLSSQAFVEDLTVKGIQDAQIQFEQPGQMQRLEKWHGEKARWVLRAWTDTWQSPEFASWSLEDCIQDVTCPVLAIHGENDKYGSIAFPRFIAGKVAGFSELLVLRDCGHIPHVEKTGAVLNAVRMFLNAHDL